MTALRNTNRRPHPRKPLRSRSVRSVPRTWSRARRCSMPASVRTEARAPASACATDARPPKALPSRPCAMAIWSERCGYGTSAPGASPRSCSARWRWKTTCRKFGVGAALMDHALAAAKARGHGAVILLGDAPYYARFGFSGREDRLNCRCRGRSSAIACSAWSCAKARSTAPGMIVPTGAAAAKAAPSGRRRAPARRSGHAMRDPPQPA